jgi:UDP-N-acetylmuramyl tripeptide synthase
MINFTKLTLFSLLLFAVACKKDPSTASNSSLVGTWNLTEESCTDGVISTTAGGQTIAGTFSSVGKNYAATVTFKDDGTYTSSGTYTSTVSTTVLGQTVTQDASIPNYAGSGKYKIDGTTLTVTDSNGKSSTAQVLENTSSKFRYKIAISVTDNSVPDYSSTTTGTYFFTLTK